MVSCQTSYNKTDTIKLNKFVNSFYQDILQSYKYINNFKGFLNFI